MAEEENRICFEEIQFFPALSQTNVYGLTRFMEDGCNKVLLASLKGGLLCISSPQSAKPSSLFSVNVPLQNLQGADIVSIDAFSSRSGLHIGVSFIKDGHSSIQKQCLNIYSRKESHTLFECVPENCQSFELDFVPFHLTHTKSFDGQPEDLFVLSGRDEKIHVFVEDPTKKQFVKGNVEEYLPEFQNVTSNVLWMDIFNIHDKRISCFVCQNGFLKLIVVDPKNGNERVNEWSSMHDGPVSSARLFTFEAKQHNISDELKEVLQLPKENNDESKPSASSTIHLLVTGVVEPSVVYEDILHNGLSKICILPDSEKYDCVVCSHVSDVDWDGANEILLGTYGQELLVYKFTKDKRKLEAKLCWTKSFAQPLYAVDYVDLTNDGVRELIVASSKGLHVLQHKFSEITSRFQEEFADEDEDSCEN